MRIKQNRNRCTKRSNLTLALLILAMAMPTSTLAISAEDSTIEGTIDNDIDLPSLLKRAETLTKTDKKEKALVVLDRAVQLSQNKQDARANYLRGKTLYQLGRFEPALYDFNKVVYLDFAEMSVPLKSCALTFRGDLFCSQAKIDEALKDFNKAVELDPTNSKAFNDRGTVFYSKKMLSEAFQDYSMAISLKPSGNLFYANRVNVLIDQNKLKDALTDSNTAVNLAPAEYFGYSQRAIVFEKMGESKLAAKDTELAKRFYHSGSSADILYFPNQKEQKSFTLSK